MTAKEWADVVVQVIDAVAWPLTLVTLVVLLRSHLPKIGDWFDRTTRERAFEASVPAIGAVRVDAPRGLELDERAIEELAVETSDPAERARLDQLAHEVATARDRIEELATNIGEDPLLTAAGYLPQRIAERARERLADPPEDVPGVSLVIGEDGRAHMLETDAAGDHALLTAISVASPFAPPSLTYEHLLEAAMLLRREGVSVSDPPFSRAVFNAAKTARSLTWTRKLP